jgi:carbon-monoxide dehydrogenase medium subunit
MGAFGYVAPTSLDEALTVLSEHANLGRRAQVLAGGTDLLVQMRSTDREPRTIVDIKKLAETNRLDVGGDEVFVGSAVPSAVLNEHGAFVALFPGLAEAADLIGSTQIQGRATLGGNLCNASPAGDTIPAMIAVGAVCVIAGSGGTREMPVADFVTGVGTNALEPDEFLVGLKIKPPAARSADAYLRFIPRTEMDIAVVGAGVCLTLNERGTCTAARAGLGAVAARPLLVTEAAEALIGTTVDAAALKRLAQAASAACQPIDDKRGTKEYRIKVAGVLARRAAEIALARARES